MMDSSGDVSVMHRNPDQWRTRSATHTSLCWSSTVMQNRVRSTLKSGFSHPTGIAVHHDISGRARCAHDTCRRRECGVCLEFDSLTQVVDVDGRFDRIMSSRSERQLHEGHAEPELLRVGRPAPRGTAVQ